VIHDPQFDIKIFKGSNQTFTVWNGTGDRRPLLKMVSLLREINLTLNGTMLRAKSRRKCSLKAPV
jgi:hypothetical protein